MEPGAGALTVTGSAPTVTVSNKIVAPGAGVLTLTGFAPISPRLIQPAAVSLSVVVGFPYTFPFVLGGSYPPIVRITTSYVTPSAGSLTLTGSTPLFNTVVTSAGATATLTGSAPSATVGKRLVPTGGALTLTGSAPTITVPTVPATVLTLAPAFFPMPTNHLRGELFTSPYVVQIVPQNNWNITAASGTTDMNTLDTYLHSVAGKKIVLGHSRGAQIIMKWLREKGPTSDIPVGDVTFIATGNPERKYNGASVVEPTVLPAVYPGGTFGVGYGLPTAATPYTVIDFARQYDFWADHPNNVTVTAAMTNARAGMAIHTDYSTVSLNDPANKRSTEGNVTYVLSPTFPMPMIAKTNAFIAWLNATFQAQSKPTEVTDDAAQRPTVEAAYTRPVVSPSPPVLWPLSATVAWNTILEDYVFL